MRIGVVAPARRLDPETAARVTALANTYLGDDAPELLFHPQCFLACGHFAGTDAERADAIVEMANDPAIDAIWFARGGYGSARIVGRVMPRLGTAARGKTWLGYSDTGTLLGALYGAGIGGVAHGPMPNDIHLEGGEAGVIRALDWLVARDPSTLEASIAPGTLAAAFNLTILSHLVGTPWLPDLDGHVLMVEEVSELLYAIDRAMAHIAASPEVRRAAGLRLGRCSRIEDNDIPFGEDELEIAERWCAEAGIPFLGRADIGHDAGNKVVPFGRR
ncbi:muramoyltetrapeptide carboxypeptidase [Sphingomonas zeicaulis]|uniref:LD-carboxypeptidase n=1 Tax=Sphingomonas zeicaulis TaxID=1632740 RepID=UPI003D23E99F